MDDKLAGVGSRCDRAIDCYQVMRSQPYGNLALAVKQVAEAVKLLTAEVRELRDRVERLEADSARIGHVDQ